MPRKKSLSNMSPSDASDTLESFIAAHEEAAQAKGVVVVKITYPGATSRIYPGKYSGIRIEDGKPSARYSDGSTN